MSARVSIRKMGTRAGHPHYGAECRTCGTVLVVAHATRQHCQWLATQHRQQGCAPTLLWATNARDNAPLRNA